MEGPSISPGNAPTSGGVNGTISGFNFGANSYSPAGRMGVSAAATTDWFSDSRVQGLIVAGVCLELDTIVTVSAQRGTQTRSFSYDHPEPINGAPPTLMYPKTHILPTPIYPPQILTPDAMYPEALKRRR